MRCDTVTPQGHPEAFKWNELQLRLWNPLSGGVASVKDIMAEMREVWPGPGAAAPAGDAGSVWACPGLAQAALRLEGAAWKEGGVHSLAPQKQWCKSRDLGIRVGYRG